MNAKLTLAFSMLLPLGHIQAQSLRVEAPTDRGSLLTLDNTGSAPWMIEGSDDLATWSPLWRVKTPDPSIWVVDEHAAGKARRFFRARDATADAGQSTQDLRTFWSHGTAANTTGSIRFTHLPMNVADFQYLIPIGLMAAQHVTPSDHLYLTLPTANLYYDVFAPANGHIVLIQKRASTGDHRVVIEHTGAFWNYYDLMTSMHPDILAAMGVAVVPDNVPQYVRIPVTAGQVIGKVGAHTLDWGVVHGEVTRGGFVVPSHYDYEPWKIHTVDPLDYYDEPLRSQLLAKAVRTAAPRGGKIDHDKDGTAAGNWFLKDTNGYRGINSGQYWVGHLALSYYHVDPNICMFSIGTWQSGQGQYWVVGNAPDPASVTEATGVVKWELVFATRGTNGQTQFIPPEMQGVRGVVLFQVLPNRELKAEIFPGLIGSQVTAFTANAKIYER